MFDGGIKYRYFLSENMALRAVVRIGFSNTTQITQQADSENDLLELKNINRSYSVLLKPGIEKHFLRYNRLSPYIGAQLLIGYNTNQRIEEHQDNHEIYLTKWENSPGHFNLGTDMFAGFDYYFIKKLYFGLEIGYGVYYNKDLKFKYTDEKYPDQNNAIKQGSSFGLSPSMATGNIRFGWTF
ncbi:MAG: hypothetical protein J7K46_05810 [Bacteroidales bacterium]|nr:hypothetical protein [Bacteroidales bacterium]